MSNTSLPFEYPPQEEPRKVKTPSKCLCPPLEEPNKVKKKEKGSSLYLDNKKRNGLDDSELDIVPVTDIKTPTSAKSIEDQSIEAPISSANEISIQCDLPSAPKDHVVKNDIEVVIEPRIEMKEIDAGIRTPNIYSETFDPCDASIFSSTPSQNTNSDDLDMPCRLMPRTPLQYGLRYNSGYPPQPSPTQPVAPQCLHSRGPPCYPYNNSSECSTFSPYSTQTNSPPCCLPKRPLPNCTPPVYSSNYPPKYFPPSGLPVCSPRRPLTSGPHFTSSRALSCPPQARSLSPCQPAPTPLPNISPLPDRYALPVNASTPCPLPQRVPARSPSPCPLTGRSRSPVPCPPLVRSQITCQSSCPPHGRSLSPLNISPNNLTLRCSMPCPRSMSPIPYSNLGAQKSASQPCSPKFVPSSSSRSPLLSAYSKSKGEPCTSPTHVSCSPDRRSFMKRLLFKKKT